MMTTRDAAVILGVTEFHVSYLVRHGHIVGTRVGRSWHLDAASVSELAERRQASQDGWISLVTAADIAGCSPSSIANAVAAGEIAQRQGLRRGAPSLELGSVRDWAEQREAARAEEACRRAEEKRQRATLQQPPDDGDVWLKPSTVALMLRLSTGRVIQLIEAERVPATRVGKRWWVRRLHAEQLALVRRQVLQAQAILGET